MAYIQGQNNQQMQQQQPQDGDQGGSMVGQQPYASSAAPGIGPSYKPTKSGRFTNLNKYIQANQGYNQGQGLAGQIYGNVSGQANRAQQQFGQGQQQFQQQAQAGRNQYNEQTVNQALANPSDYAQNAQNVQQFQQMETGQYGGPQGIGNEQQYLQSGQNIQNLANLGQTESGRYALLKNLYGTPSYSRGQQSLDNLLLQANPGQLQQLQQLNPLAQGLNQNVQQGLEQARQQAQQYGQEAQQTQQRTREALGNAIAGFNTQAENELQQALANREQAFQGLQGQLGQGQLSAADAAKFGLSGGQALYNLDPSKYLSQSSFQATKQNVISPEEYARISALGKLAGQNLQGPASATLEEFNKGPSEAGQFAQQQAANFDTARFLQDVAEKKGAYEQGKSFSQDITKDLADVGTTDYGRLGDILRSGTAGAIPDITSGRASINDINQYLSQLPQLQQRLGQLEFISPTQSGAEQYNQQTRQAINDVISRQVPALQSIIDRYNQQYGIGRQLNVV